MIVTEPKTILDFRYKLERALAYTKTHTIGDVADELRTGNAQLWLHGDGLLITQIEDKPRERILVMWLAAGDMDDVLLLRAEAEEWSVGVGCTRGTMVGRRGWRKALAGTGWEPRDDLTVFEKDLGDG